MKRQGVLVAAMAASITISAAAQDPPGTGRQGTSKSDQNQTVTVTGCLSNAAASATTSGTTGSGQAKGKEQQFLLTNATVGASGTATGGATAGTAGTGTNYRLTGGNREELQKYLNSRVEIRGTLQPRGEGQSGGRATAPGQEKSAQAADLANIQTLRVTSVKQLSASCEAR